MGQRDRTQSQPPLHTSNQRATSDKHVRKFILHNNGARSEEGSRAAALGQQAGRTFAFNEQSNRSRGAAEGFWRGLAVQQLSHGTIGTPAHC